MTSPACLHANCPALDFSYPVAALTLPSPAKAGLLTVGLPPAKETILVNGNAVHFFKISTQSILDTRTDLFCWKAPYVIVCLQ